MPGFTPSPRTDPTVVEGVRGPENLNQYRVKIEMQDKILRVLPEATPLIVLTRRARNKRTVNNYKFEWLWKDEQPRVVHLVAAALVGDTTLELSTGEGARMAQYYTVRNLRTGELCLVTATPAADIVTVVRGIGGNEIDMAIGDELIFLAPGYEDGVTKGSFVSIKDENEYNYCQIFRTPFGVTGRLAVTDAFGGRDPMTEKAWQGVEHLKSIEMAMLFGQRYSRTGTTHLQTLTGGMEYFIRTNVWDNGGAKLTERSFDEYLEEGLRYGDGGYINGQGTKYLFHSARWGTEIAWFAKDRLQYRVLDKQIGLAANEYTSPHGKVMLIHDPILDAHFGNMAVLLDMNHVRIAVMEGRDTKLMSNIEDNSADASEWEYFTDCGLQLEMEFAHGILKL